ncbi:hypothetical protein NBRC10512_004343 [Rhodotorula toruloides]|uniref:RHTO0S17e00430g1_1 n=2 Tax=Rhodotorula toruloides TaxID=5286 RepID=A0A061BG01_RHOTO|nr:VHS domain containing protein [Rhodotorula toruloides NP11]EMS20397.1 VHS domain containing protein [Rhodotorula toruloides NP11]CDR48287.1 RHTO0S17e00430g1_1 [Rhodotorula toruloides]
MKRLFNKSKRTASSPSTETPSPSHTPPSHPATPTPPLAPAHSRPAPTPPPHPQQVYEQGGQQYVLVPVPVGQWQAQQGGCGRAGGGGGVPRPPSVRDVGNAIGWSCAMPSFDWSYILSLAEYLSSSSSASKDAAKALVKEFKHATPNAQERAVRLTGILFRNTNERFQEQVASKKFLTALTALLSSPSTPPATKRMIYLTLSPLAYDAQSSPSLSNITKTFNALLEDSKTGLRSFDNEFEETDPRWQPNGAPVDADDPLFAPEALPRRRERARMFDGIEQMRDLRRRAVEGRGWAGMLCDAVANARDEAGVGAGKRWEEMSGEEKEAEQARLEGEEGQGESERRDGLEANEVVQEIHAKLLETQEFLTSNLDWAAVQASHSRAKLPSSPQPPAGLASNNPFAAVVEGRREGEGSTEEEEILAELLSATTEISDALALYASRLSHSRTQAREQADLLAAVERSKAENHVDRFGHEVERSRDYGEGGSGPREEGYESVAREGKGKGREGESLNPYAGYLVDGANDQAHSQTNVSPYDGLDALEGLSLSSPSRQPTSYAPPQASSATFHRRSFSPTNPYASFAQPAPAPETPFASHPNITSGGAAPDPFADADGAGQTESAFLREYVPSQPSEKALGKLRRVSVGQNAEPDRVDQQRRLEEALRERYARNYQEEQERRTNGAEHAQ